MNYRFEWISGPAFLGAVLVLPFVPHFALIVLVVVALAVVAAVVALAAAMLAMPYRLVRALHRRLAKRREPTEGSVPIASVAARTGLATRQSGVAALANTTPAVVTREPHADETIDVSASEAHVSPSLLI